MADPSAGHLLDLAWLLASSALAFFLLGRLGFPSIASYLLAGVLVGPQALGRFFLHDLSLVQSMAVLGVVFLLFFVGLEVGLPRLLSLPPSTLLSGILGVLFLGGTTYLALTSLGWRTLPALALSGAISISSTSMAMRLLEERRELHVPHAHVALGILLVEDLLAVGLLALFSAAALGSSSNLSDVTQKTVLALLLAVGGVVLGALFVPRLLDRIARTGSVELLVISSVAVVLASSALFLLLGFSAALGAFLSGAISSESRSAAKIHDRLLSLKELFTALFFVAVGMLADLTALLDVPLLALSLLGLATVGKVFFVFLGGLLSGVPSRKALQAGSSLAVVGEFSFVIADQAVRSSILPPAIISALVFASIGSALLSPIVARLPGALPEGVWTRVGRFSSFSEGWVERALSSKGEGLGKKARSRLLRMGIHGSWLLGIALGASLLVHPVELLLSSRGLPAGWGAPLVGGIFLLLGAPFLVGFLRNGDALLADLALRALPRAPPTSPALRVQLNLLRLLAVGVGGIVLLLLLPSTLRTLPAIAVALGVLLFLLLLRENLLEAHRRIESGLERVLGRGSEVGVLAESVERSYPWGIEVETVVLPPGAWGVGRSLREINLRRRTGSSILLIERKGRRIVNPPPETLLEEGDRLSILGDPAEIREAQRLLLAPREEEGHPQVRWVEILLPSSTPLQGKTLLEVGIRERTGASIVAVGRGDDRFVNPSSDFVLQGGDVLLLVGSPEEVARARSLLLEE